MLHEKYLPVSGPMLGLTGVPCLGVPFQKHLGDLGFRLQG